MVKFVKNPGNRRLNNLNDPVLNVLRIEKKGPADVELLLQTGRWVTAGPVDGKCVRQKGEKIDNQRNAACFEISFILLTQLTADSSSAVVLVVGRSVSKTA